MTYKILVLLVLLFGCAGVGQQSSRQLRDFMLVGNYQNALSLVQSDKFYPEERSRLLKWVEEGTLLHINGSYYQSLQVFDKAKELSDRLFTQSISKKALSAVASDSLDNYYGERYERSLIRFYQALNHYMLFQIGVYDAPVKEQEKSLSEKERQFHLSASRAVILEWDSLLSNYRSVRGGESVYKDDLMAKIFGAFIHLQMANASDHRIALSLYKKAKEVLFRNYNSYPTFNSKYSSFRKDFEKLPHMPLKDVMQNYVGMTRHYKKLENYLDSMIGYFSKKKNEQPNIYFIVKNSNISPKSANKFDFPLPLAQVAALSGNGAFAFTTLLLDTASGQQPSISFELPEVKIQPTKFDMELVIMNGAGKVVGETSLALIDPLSDIAYEAMDESKTAVYSKIGGRVALKHATAIGSAFLTYNLAVNAGTPKFIAQITAAASYKIANSAIAESEKADLRCWQTLPHDLRMGGIRLQKGKYRVSIKKVDENGNISLVDAGEIVVENPKVSKLINLRIN